MGEFSETMLDAKLYSGELRDTDLYRGQGMATWRQVGSRKAPATYGQTVSSFTAADGARPTLSLVLDTPAVLGLLGSLLTLFGVFAPAAVMPLLGSMSLLQNGRSIGLVVIVSAVGSAGLVAVRRFRGLWLTGSLTLLCLAISLAAFQYEIHQMKHSADRAKGEFFAGLESAAADATQLGWGYGVLSCGVILLFAAAATGTGKLQFRR